MAAEEGSFRTRLCTRGQTVLKDEVSELSSHFYLFHFFTDIAKYLTKSYTSLKTLKWFQY